MMNQVHNIFEPGKRGLSVHNIFEPGKRGLSDIYSWGLTS